MNRRRKRPTGPSSEDWNAMYGVGTRVRYWRGIREGEGSVSVTRSKAWDMCGHASVLIEGTSGSIALTHVQPEPDEAQGESEGAS